MRNIWKIFLGDVKHLRTNVIAWIIIIGITVVPSLYAWFNIAASWDPYGNTGNLKIAVANEDEGYTGQLLSTELNMGDLVIARLSRNTKMKWTFTTSADAIDGVESGKYYAAVVIPSSFSSDMMSLFSKNVHETKILYYLNEKANAIAPKITDKGAGSIQRGIREEVTKVVADVSLNTLTDLSDQLNNVETDGIAQNFLTNMQNIESGLSTSAATLRAFSSLVDSLDIMLTSTSDLLKTTGTNITDNTKNLSDAASQVPALTSDFSGITDTINTMLAQLSDSYSGLSTQIDGSFDSIGSNVRDSSQSVEGVKNEVSAILTDFTAVRDNLSSVRDALAAEELPTGAADALLDRMDSSIATQQSLLDTLTNASDSINEAVDKAATNRSDLNTKMQAAINDITALQSSYEANLETDLSDLFGRLTSANATISDILSRTQTQTAELSDTAADASENLADLQKALDDSAALLEEADTKLQTAIDSLRTGIDSGDLSVIQTILQSNPSDVAAFLSAPVALNTHKLFPVENYGSAMAPFYSTLAIWVGATVMVAMMLVELSEDRRKELTAGGRKLRHYQTYFGRHILFTLIGLAQATLICLGDLFFLQIQCVHPFLFLVTGWVTSIVYTSIIYTLTISFGDVGKAACVILMVIQVAGSGGTFPIEMTPPIFQRLYPILPFVHSMDAMRECIAGFYGSTFLTELGHLFLYVAAALLLGLVLRAPIIRLNHLFTERLEDTKLM